MKGLNKKGSRSSPCSFQILSLLSRVVFHFAAWHFAFCGIFIMETMVVVLLIYLTISLVISGFMNWYNKKMALVER